MRFKEHTQCIDTVKKHLDLRMFPYQKEIIEPHKPMLNYPSMALDIGSPSQ